MKSFFSFLLCLGFVFFAQAQNEDVARSEANPAILNFQANPNTANYDIVYNRLHLEVNPAVQYITGEVTAHFRAKEAMNQIVFDLASNLNVSAITQRGANLTYTRMGDELRINLQGQLAAQVLDSLTISYYGVPDSSDDAFVTHTHQGTPALFTLSEPYGAKEWWPCKQDLNDKIDSIDIFIKAPSQYVAVANGMEQGYELDGFGNKITHFSHNYPIPAYLVAIAVTNYQTYTQQAGTAPHTFPIINYLYPENYNTNVNRLAETLPIMNLFESLFGTYPFSDEKYGHAQFGWGGGMEHTTVSFMGSFDRSLIAHELAHQWFGNQITCASWQDIWLNEGFATYLSGLVIEHLDGPSSFVSWKSGLIQSITSQPGGSLYVPASELSNSDRIFSSRLSYNKGGMVVHMLRFLLGDEVFYQAINNYLTDPELAYGYATTSQLKAHLEQASGRDLTDFFSSWVYGQGYPIYTIQGTNIDSGQFYVRINQTQSHNSVSYYKMPVPLRLNGSGGQSMEVVLDNEVNGQEYMIQVPFTVTSITFDPNKNLISKNSNAFLSSNGFESNTVKVFPNPVKDQLQIVVSGGLQLQAIALYDVNGQVLLEQKTSDTIDFSKYAEGVYLLEVQTNEGVKQIKILK